MDTASNRSAADTDSSDHNDNSSSGSICEQQKNTSVASWIDTLKDPKCCECTKRCDLLYINNKELMDTLLNDVTGMTPKSRKQQIYSSLISSVNIKSSILSDVSNRNRVIYSIPYVGKVCREYFCTFWRTGKTRIQNYMDYIQKNRSLIAPSHGNCNNANASISDETYSKIEDFLIILKKNYGEPIATRKFIRESVGGKLKKITIEKEDIVYLPSYFSYQNIYDQLKLESPEYQFSIKSIKRFWHGHEKFKNLKIRNPSKDVCDECYIFKNIIASLNDEEITEKGEELNASYQSHIAQYRFMRNEYENDILRSRDIENNRRPIVLSFDYAQNVDIPHLSQQPGFFYFASLKKAYQFGIVDEELDQHYHYIYMESEGGKGSDNVVSMVLHHIKTIQTRRSKHLILWADNCGGQNKNSTMIHTLLELVKNGQFDVVELKFQIKGHTRNSVDRGFSYTKREYLSSDVYSLECFANIISRAAVNSLTDGRKCIPVKIEKCEDMFKCYTSFYSNIYRKCPKIQSYQIFKTLSTEINYIFCGSLENDIRWGKNCLLVNNKKIEELKVMKAVGYPKEKEVDFYNGNY